jgi:hypothetical protein
VKLFGILFETLGKLLILFLMLIELTEQLNQELLRVIFEMIESQVLLEFI